jgi:Cu(I)/Ag(I) efflux system membrane fusion protein
VSTDRLLTFGLSRTQLDEIARTKVVPDGIRILAPADGFVLSRNLSVGQKLDRGDELYRIADLSRVWIVAELFGSEAQQVRPGLSAAVFIPGRPTSMSARVSAAVLPQFDARTQSTQLRLDADNPGYLLRPGMFVDVELAVPLPAAVTVPADAVVDSGLRKTVFVERGDGVFESREVQTGWRAGARVEIVTGLSPGERIVVSGAFLLDSEFRIRHPQAPGSRP